MPHSVRKLLQPFLYLSVLVLCSSGVLAAQAPAMKLGPAPNIALPPPNPFADISVTVAGVPNGAFKTALLAVFANDTSLSYAVSLNATDVAYKTFETGMPGMSCSPTLVATCSASISVYHDTIYIAYVDRETQGLNVVVAEPIPGQPDYHLRLFHQDTRFVMTSSPTMTVYRGYLVIYFNGHTPAGNNGFFGVGFDGTNWLGWAQVASL
jgi:hypothetical protein